MDWKNIKHIENNQYELPGQILFPHYFEAFNTLFRTENSLRIIVYVVLKLEFTDKWKDINVTSDDEDSSTISAIAKKRINQDNNFAYLGYSSNNPLMYLTSGELIRIITSDQYWKLFKQYFMGGREIMRIKLDEIGNIRNSLAHFRPIKSGDVDLIKQNAIHTLSKIEETISSILDCPTVVPSNTLDEWYKELSTVGTEHCNLSFKQSEDENWVKLIITVSSPIIERNSVWENFNRYKIVRLNVPSILNNFKTLTKKLICVTEKEHYIRQPEENPTFRKSFEMRLSRDVLKTQLSDIKIETEEILRTIEKEIELIKQDDLAKGSIIEVITITGEPDKHGYWTYQTEKLKSPISDNDPVEFWGESRYAFKNYISNADNFPWMNTKISEDKDLPF